MIQRAKSTAATASATPIVRVAIYTRKSTNKGLETSDFSSIDLQREAAEAYVKSQAGNGWVALPERFDDGGWSGGDVERPALQRILRLVEERKVDVIVVYKLDRLSRSLHDFTKLIELFQSRGVSFASVSESFSTASSTGRLLVNILMSFAQHERELIRERTAAKAGAARRRGMWIGGFPALGYDVAAKGGKLEINDAEAEVVRTAFSTYSARRSLLATAADLNKRGFRTKTFESRGGRRHGGREWDKGSVAKLVSNPLYIGRVVHKGEEFPGEHPAIIDDGTWNAVQEIRRANGRNDGGAARGPNRYGTLLKGLVRCKACACWMTNAFTVRRGKRYAFYVCLGAQKKGWATCPSKSVPTGEMDRFVIGKIAAIGRDPHLQSEVAAQARRIQTADVERLQAEHIAARRELKSASGALARQLGSARPAEVDAAGANPETEDLRHKVEALAHRVEELGVRIAATKKRTIDSDDVARALVKFDEVFEALNTAERARLLALILERIDYHGGESTIDLVFRPGGFEAITADKNGSEIEEPA